MKSKGRLIPLLTRLLTRKAEKGESVDKVASEMRRFNEQVGLIDDKAKLNEVAFGLCIMNAFRDIRRFHLAIYHLENDEEKLTP